MKAIKIIRMKNSFFNSCLPTRQVVFKSFKDSGLSDLIDKQLGKRVKTIGFSYSDIFANHLAIYLNGGDCTEDVNDHLREHLQNVRGMQVCSADTILRGFKELAAETLFLEKPGFYLHSFLL